jgi:hypothetical protein
MFFEPFGRLGLASTAEGCFRHGALELGLEEAVAEALLLYCYGRALDGSDLADDLRRGLGFLFSRSQLNRLEHLGRRLSTLDADPKPFIGTLARRAATRHLRAAAPANGLVLR